MDHADPLELAEARIDEVLNDRWRLVRPLAMGGSAWLYVAEDRRIAGGFAAVKVLHSGLVEHQEVVSRFVRESRVANKINHRGVVRILDEGRTYEGMPFLVMDLLDGETLDARAERKGGRLPVREVLWAMDEVLAVLRAAHEQGILHRDVKPENIFLTQDHVIKLLDFGIARILDQIASEQSTRVGTMMGTLAFMAPEQGRGEWDTVGVTTDLWAVGATMFALLTGRAVHEEQDLYSQMKAVMSEPAPPMAQVAPDVPRPVQILVDQALEFDPKKRWLDAHSMQLALRLAYRTMDDAPPDSSADSDEYPAVRGARVPRPPLFLPPSVPPMSRRFPEK